MKKHLILSLFLLAACKIWAQQAIFQLQDTLVQADTAIASATFTAGGGTCMPDTASRPLIPPAYFVQDSCPLRLASLSFARKSFLGGICNDDGSSTTFAAIEGIGTEAVELTFWVNARGSHDCSGRSCVQYDNMGHAALSSSITLLIDGLPPGNNASLSMDWVAWVFILNEEELEPDFVSMMAGAGDRADIANSQISELSLNGNSLLGMGIPSLGLSGNTTNKGMSTIVVDDSSLMVQNGDSLKFVFQGSTRGEIHEWSKGITLFGEEIAEEDKAQGAVFVKIRINLPAREPIPRLFSLQIGSDTEVSDSAQQGNEVFDPGDMYVWSANTMGMPSQGFWDDAQIFNGIDPSPVPASPGTAAPVCQALGWSDSLSKQFLDLDGFDAIDIDLASILPMGNLISLACDQIYSDCIIPMDKAEILLSFDDDNSTPYVGDPFLGCLDAVPSKRNINPKGTTDGKDEVLLAYPVNITSAGGNLNYAFPALLAIADEKSIHADLGPNPLDSLGTSNDEVNALDVFEKDSCGFSYFSVSSEARGLDTTQYLSAGIIYQSSSAATPVRAILPGRDLGITDTASLDIDAFEFTWLRIKQTDELRLALLFSVAPDNPETFPENESGGLAPGQLYFSFLEGVHAPLPGYSFSENLDAIALAPFNAISKGPNTNRSRVAEPLLARIYPNPVTKGHVVIEVSDQHRSNNPLFVEVYDLSGRLRLQKVFHHTTHSKLNVQQLSKGLYLFRLSMGEKTTFRRIIIQ